MTVSATTSHPKQTMSAAQVTYSRPLMPITPAMAAGVADRLWSMEGIAEAVEARRPKPGKRGPYKKWAVQA